MKSSNMIREASKVMFSSIGEVVEQVTANETNTRSDSTSAGLYSQSQNLSQPLVAFPSLAQRRKALGKLLFRAANLLEALDFSLEEKLIYEYLHRDPPLHPRRTLDQSHYGALKNTETRDRDQVVYRATSPAAHVCERDQTVTQAVGKCKQCRDDIRMVPRLIMVDQLWLWILDESKSSLCAKTQSKSLDIWSYGTHFSLQIRSLPVFQGDGARISQIHRLFTKDYAPDCSLLAKEKFGRPLI